MTAPSRNNLIANSKKRSKKILEYIKNNKSRADTKMVKNVFQFDKIEAVKVFDLPRDLLILNPENGRFEAELDIIREERKSKGMSLELDPENDKDVEIIRNMLKGIHPKNAERDGAFKKLYENIEEVASKTGTNGQEEPGIITHDGILVNGNRRDTVMEELAISTKKKKGNPLKYNNLRVAILDKDVSAYDLWKNEAKEQISQESREEYDYVNSALEIKRGYALLTKKGLTDKKAKDEISKTLYGRSVKDVESYLDFLKIADLFLKQIGKKGQHRYIQDSGSKTGEKGIVTILKEVAKQRIADQKAGKDDEEIAKWFKAASLFCVISKRKPTISKGGKTKKLNFGHRDYRRFMSKAMATPETRKRVLDSKAFLNVKITDPSLEHMNGFNDAIDSAIGLYDIQILTINPLSLLQKAQDALSELSKDLNSSHKKEMLKIMKDGNGDQIIKDVKSLIAEITKKNKNN